METGKLAMVHKAETVAPPTTDSAINSDRFESKPDSFQQKHSSSNVSVEHGSDSDEPVYETGWRLWAVMFTIFLTTLLAALDIVSIP